MRVAKHKEVLTDFPCRPGRGYPADSSGALHGTLSPRKGTVARLHGIVKVAHENVDTNLGIVQAISLARALAGRGGEGGMKSFQLKGNPETLPNGDAVLVPDEAANEQVLENFRDTSPTSPGQDHAPAEGPPSSEC